LFLRQKPIIAFSADDSSKWLLSFFRAIWLSRPAPVGIC
jgi:hypothetical protein